MTILKLTKGTGHSESTAVHDVRGAVRAAARYYGGTPLVAQLEDNILNPDFRGRVTILEDHRGYTILAEPEHDPLKRIRKLRRALAPTPQRAAFAATSTLFLAGAALTLTSHWTGQLALRTGAMLMAASLTGQICITLWVMASLGQRMLTAWHEYKTHKQSRD